MNEHTPRTDSMVDSCGDYEKPPQYIKRLTAFARSLETELATLESQNDRLFEAVYAALPYVECVESDLGYKPGVVAGVVRLLRQAIAEVEASK